MTAPRPGPRRSAPKSRAAGRPKSVRRAVRELAQTTYEEAILDAAERVFARVGYAQAKMTDLARATGVSVGTLYNYFESKQAVFQAISRRNIRRLLESLESVREPDPIARVRALLDRTLHHSEAHSPLFVLFMQLGGMSELDIGRILGSECQDAYVHALGLAQAAIADAARAGKLRVDIDSESLATYLAGMVNAAIFAWLRRGRDRSLVTRTEQIMQMFLEGARAR